MSALPKPVNNPSRSGSRPRPLNANATLQANAQASIQKQTSQIAIESVAVLGVNLILICTAIFTLATLVPQQLTRNQKLQEVRSEESQVANHINELKQDEQLSQNPAVARRIAEENGSFMQSDKHQVVFLKTPKHVQ